MKALPPIDLGDSESGDKDPEEPKHPESDDKTPIDTKDDAESTNGGEPRTGDETNLLAAFMIMICALTSAIIVFRRKER